MRNNLKIHRPDLCNISDDAVIGDNVIIHPFVSVYSDVKIGNNVKIQNGCFLPNGSIIEDECFLGPFTVLTNDKNPPSNHIGWQPVIMRMGSSTGANVTILPGVEIGKGSMVGAGSIVTKSIPPNEVWIGNPAKFYKMRNEL